MKGLYFIYFLYSLLKEQCTHLDLVQIMMLVS